MIEFLSVENVDQNMGASNKLTQWVYMSNMVLNSGLNREIQTFSERTVGFTQSVPVERQLPKDAKFS